MKQLIILSIAILFSATTIFAKGRIIYSENFETASVNGDAIGTVEAKNFNSGASNWIPSIATGAEAISGNRSACIDITDAGAEWWGLQFKLENATYSTVAKGFKYKVSFKIKSATANNHFRFAVQAQSSFNLTSVAVESGVALGNDVYQFDIETPAMDSQGTANFLWAFGQQANAGKVWIDDIVITELYEPNNYSEDFQTHTISGSNIGDFSLNLYGDGVATMQLMTESGNKYLRINVTDPKSDWWTVQFRNSDKYAVVKGKQYVATFKAKASTALNCKFRMENTTDFERALPLTDSWQNFSFTTNGMDKTGFMNIIFGLGNPVPAGASIDIDDIEIYEKRFDLEIGASETHDAADFATTNYWNITFSSDASGTAQLSNIPAEGITVGGVVKIKKTFTDAKWYAVGFPFAIAEIRSNHASYPVLSAWNGTEGDFWAKTYNGASDEFNDYAGSALPAGGYAIQFPPVLLNQEITFVSAPDVILNNSSQWNVAASGYKLAANPSVANTTVSASDADKYYILDLNKPANFGLLTAGTHDLQPFESVVVANGIETAALRSSLNIETITGIHETPASDAIKEVRYYNLQGLEIPATAHSAGVVIVKTVYQSGAVSLSKIIRK